MESTPVPTPQQVFQHHAEVLIGGDLEGIVSDYSDDVVGATFRRRPVRAPAEITACRQ